jgi:hypothetical protein
MNTVGSAEFSSSRISGFTSKTLACGGWSMRDRWKSGSADAPVKCS